MSAIMAIWDFFEGMRANPHDDDVLDEYKARQRQLFSTIVLMLFTCLALVGATSFFNAADSSPTAPLAMFAGYRKIVGMAFLAVYGVLSTFALFCAYRIMRLRALHGAPQ